MCVCVVCRTVVSDSSVSPTSGTFMSMSQKNGTGSLASTISYKAVAVL